MAVPSHCLKSERVWARATHMEVFMAEIRESYAAKDRGFGGKMGSRKTRWVAFVITASLVVVGAIYLLPQIL
jgi:hypothetical protein